MSAPDTGGAKLELGGKGLVGLDTAPYRPLITHSTVESHMRLRLFEVLCTEVEGSTRLPTTDGGYHDIPADPRQTELVAATSPLEAAQLVKAAYVKLDMTCAYFLVEELYVPTKPGFLERDRERDWVPDKSEPIAWTWRLRPIFNGVPYYPDAP
jgi:hypothetical protein